MSTIPYCTLAFTVFAGIALVLQGCGGGGGDTTPTPGPPTPETTQPPGPCTAVPNCQKCDDGTSCTQCRQGFQPTGTPTQCMYACESDLTMPIAHADKKGLCMDDTTHHWCPSKIHSQWPNTANEPAKYIRINKAWESDWGETKEEAWNSIAAYLHATGAKALVGTSLTCDAAADANDWADVQKLLKKIGAPNVAGVAIGNELELLQYKSESVKGTFATLEACSINMWKVGGYLQTTFESHVNDLDQLEGDWTNVKVTSVFGAAINYPSRRLTSVNESIPRAGYTPAFRNQQQALVDTFFQNILKKYPKRYVFTINVYPYFDQGNHCTDSDLARSVCFDKVTCLIHYNLGTTLDTMEKFDANNPDLSMKDLDFWLTETGWSSPIAQTLPNQNPATGKCAKWSTEDSMKKYYENFLAWDMTVPQHTKKVDVAFWFTMRDAGNFGQQEHFGLGGSGDMTKLCEYTKCKLQAPSESDDSKISVV